MRLVAEESLYWCTCAAVVTLCENHKSPQLGQMQVMSCDVRHPVSTAAAAPLMVLQVRCSMCVMALSAVVGLSSPYGCGRAHASVQEDLRLHSYLQGQLQPLHAPQQRLRPP